MLRSAWVSLFWNVIAFRKENGGFALKMLAEKIGINKSAPSRWFSGDRPNWTVNTLSDIAEALNVDLEIYARDRQSGTRFSPIGKVAVSASGGPSVSPMRNPVEADNPELRKPKLVIN
jgi:hypothetical protein